VSRVHWRNGMSLPVVDNARSVPKKPVIWIGEIWLQLPTGFKDIRAWRANKPLTRQQAQTVLHQLLEELIDEHGNDAAVDSGFWMKSR
jgi:hypothetical protein